MARYAERMEQQPPSKKSSKPRASSPKPGKRKPRPAAPARRPEPETLLPVIRTRLNVLFPDHDEQIAWMERVHPLFAISPLEMIHSGREAQLLAHLEAWLREEK